MRVTTGEATTLQGWVKAGPAVITVEMGELTPDNETPDGRTAAARDGDRLEQLLEKAGRPLQKRGWLHVLPVRLVPGRGRRCIVEPGAVKLRLEASGVDIRGTLWLTLTGPRREVGAVRVLEPDVRLRPAG